MKKFLVMSLLFSTILMSTSCTTKTSHGECVGLSTDTIKNPNKVYQTDFKNVALAVFFFQTIWVPINVIGYNLDCPIAEKKEVK